MKKDRINHNALTHLVEAGAVSVAIAKAMGDTWVLSILVGDTEKVVMAKNSGKPRVWRKLDTLAKYLKDLGLPHFTTDVTQYDPSVKSLRRPDSANTLKQTHKAHQSLQKSVQTQSESDVRLKGELEPAPSAEQAKPSIEPPEKVNTVKPETTQAEESVSKATKLNTTDLAIQKAKERWELRRAKILQESDPRAR